MTFGTKYAMAVNSSNLIDEGDMEDDIKTHLLHYRQADEEGVVVIIEREILHVAADHIASLEARIAELSAAQGEPVGYRFRFRMKNGEITAWHNVDTLRETMHPDGSERNEVEKQYLYAAPPSIAADQVAPAVPDEHCMCLACKDGTIHDSDCSVHNMPAYPNGPCDCSVALAQSRAISDAEIISIACIHERVIGKQTDDFQFSGDSVIAFARALLAAQAAPVQEDDGSHPCCGNPSVCGKACVERGRWLERKDGDAIDAMRPFAALLQPHNCVGSNDRPIFGINRAVITLGDLRKAQSIVDASTKEQP